MTKLIHLQYNDIPMNEELISQIEELGLSNKEARVYVANLMLGPAGVQQIADTSGIKRVTTYVILEALVNLGLASQTTKAKRTLFNAEAPENLRRLLEKREESIQEQKQQLDELLPSLASLTSLPKEAPSVKFYDSAEGIQTVMKTVMADAKEAGVKQLYGMSNLDQLHTFFPSIRDAEANLDRVRSGITSKYIYTSKSGSIYRRGDTENLRESRYVPQEKYPLEGDITIIGDRIVMLSLTGPRTMGVVIASQELSRTARGLFELAWEAAKVYN